MSDSNILKYPDVSDRGKTSENISNSQQAAFKQQAAFNRIHREKIEKNFFKGVMVAIAISIPIWAIIIYVIKIVFF